MRVEEGAVNTAADLARLLREPPEDAKGWTRWWWYGCAVTLEEIRRELTCMAQAGLGGVEIQILYPLAADDPEAGIYNIPYFSPAFFDILDSTITIAKELGLGVDFTLGSSWPYGGPFIPADMAAQSVTTWQMEVAGPCPSYQFDFTTHTAGKIIRVVMGRMENSRMLEETLTDLTDHLEDKLLYGWPWGTVLRNVEIPEGNWKIVALVAGQYHQTLGIPTRDAQGFAMDHCRKDVTAFFLKNAAQPLLDRLGSGRLRCLFCDSIELSGNNWTESLPEEFLKRRGYDLTPYLYALWGQVGDISDRVRCDYYRTMSELTLENFFGALTEWCSDRGLLSRIQAHGTWADILKAYALADVPEGESFGVQDKLEVNSIHRRFASSAAHVYGKPIVSNESFTWLRMPRFLVTLENVKAAADAIFLDGMNAIYNHGYSYSPPEAGTPGWPFYASSNLNHTNPAWDCYPQLARYIQRVSAVLRQGFARSDAAIYLPQADVWSETPIANLHMAMRLQERFGWDVPDHICRSGYSFDYVNDEALQSLGVMDGGLRIGENTYKILILIGCTRLPVETAQALERFVLSGGILVAAEAAPDRSCGLLDRQRRDGEVRAVMERIFPAEKNVWQSAGQGFAAIAPDRREGLVSLLRQKRLPDMEILPAGCPVGYQHRQVPGGDLYFLANLSPETQCITVSAAVPNSSLGAYDAMTARSHPVLPVLRQGGRTYVQMELEPFGSVFLFFGTGAVTEPQTPVQEERLTLSGPWVLEVPEKQFACTQAQPVFWQTYTPLKYFSGPGDYITEFDLPSLEGKQVILELEQAADAVRVSLNGAPCGKLWKRPWRIDVTEAARQGRNRLVIRCTGPLINQVLQPGSELPDYPGTLVDGWPYFSEVINPIRRRRIGYDKERMAVNEPRNAGIQGEVRMILRSISCAPRADANPDPFS